MEGYEIYRLSDEEIQHFGVKGMKWGKRKSRSAYMTAVDKHEAKTKANREKVAAHKAREKEQGKAVAKAIGTKYMNASRSHEAKTTAKRDAKKAASKAKYEQEKADFANAKKAVKQAGKNYIERNKAKESARLEKRVETKAKFKADTKTTINKFRDAAAMMEEEKQTKRDAKKAASKAKYEQEKADFANAKKAVKQAGKNYIERNKAKESARLEKRVETKAKFKADTKTTINKFRDAAAMMEEEKQTKREVKGAARKQLAKDTIENYKKRLVKSLDDPMVKALVASSIYANNSYSMDSTRTGANAHRQMFY